MFNIENKDKATVDYLIKEYGFPKKLSKKIINASNGIYFMKDNDEERIYLIVYNNGVIDQFIDEQHLVETLTGRGFSVLEEDIKDISFFIIEDILYDKYEMKITYINEFTSPAQCTYGILFDNGSILTFKDEKSLNRSVAGIDPLPVEGIDDINIIICNKKSYLNYDLSIVFHEPKHQEVSK